VPSTLGGNMHQDGRESKRPPSAGLSVTCACRNRSAPARRQFSRLPPSFAAYASALDTDVGGASPGLPVLDPDTVRHDARAEGVALARYRAYLAKAHVLWDFGRLEAGDAVFRNIA